MKFAHMADCHIGAWREPKLREANTRAFTQAIDLCIHEKVDFVLMAGDLFNTSVPAIESLRFAVEMFKKLKDCNIQVYFIPGSHDFSPSGKTMLDVLEIAGLGINVSKFEEKDGRVFLNFAVDKKTGIKITGLFGRKGGLEKNYYYNLSKENLEREPGKKIFMFHSPIEELKPEELGGMEAMGLSLLPKGFDYYAGGHVHVINTRSFDNHRNVIYPGPIFPNNFAEIEKLRGGSFCLVEDWNVQQVKLAPYPVVCININCDKKTSRETEDLLIKELKSQKVDSAIITIRISGCLKEGSPSDINLKELFKSLYERGAHFVMKNTNKLTSMEFEEVEVKHTSSEELEEEVIREYSGKSGVFDKEKETELVKDLIKALAIEKNEGERIIDFEDRIKSELDKILQM